MGKETKAVGPEGSKPVVPGKAASKITGSASKAQSISIAQAATMLGFPPQVTKTIARAAEFVSYFASLKEKARSNGGDVAPIPTNVQKRMTEILASNARKQSLPQDKGTLDIA